MILLIHIFVISHVVAVIGVRKHVQDKHFLEINISWIVLCQCTKVGIIYSTKMLNEWKLRPR